MVNHPNRAKGQAPDGAPAVGSFVNIPFGARSSQVAHVVGYAKDGRLKVRAWNGAQGKWMPGVRLQPMGKDVTPASASHLPTPPSTGA